MEKTCQALYRWSLIGLVGAFLDLGIVYCLLCASGIAYMASKFLGFFGMQLPCPCGVFHVTDPNTKLCLQKLLIEYPTEKVSNVQLSVMSKFPFHDSMWGKDRSYDVNFRLIGNRESDIIEMEGEASCSSLVSDARKSNSIVRIKGDLNATKEMRLANVFGEKEGRFDLKGKGIMHQRYRSGIRRRKKGSSDFGKYSSFSSYDPSIEEVQVGALHSSPTIYKRENELVEDSIVLQPFERDKHQFNYTEETPPITRQRSLNRFELREYAGFHDDQAKELKNNLQSGGNISSEDRNKIRLLEQALEEEQAAHAALYLELEKERSAAASAADEAMAMILRLQEEKASIEMEARQFQRMTEEKSVYDAEEMNILKEIIIRREREKHFLEKEVEAYRQSSNIGNEHSSGIGVDSVDQQQVDCDYSFHLNDDPALMLRRLSSAIDKKVMAETKRLVEVVPSDKGKGEIVPQKELSSKKLDDAFGVEEQGYLGGHFLDSNDESSDFQDKLISVDGNSYAPAAHLQRSESFYQSYLAGNSEEKLQEETTIPLRNGVEYQENMNIPAGVAGSDVESFPVSYGNMISKQHENGSNLGPESSCNFFRKERQVHDVQVVDDQANSSNQEKGIGLDFMTGRTAGILRNMCSPSEAPAVKSASTASCCQVTSSSNAEVNVRTSSDISSRLPPLCPKGKSLTSLRRNSLSDVDNERLKIDYEVGWLQERLKVVQAGREKLNMTMECQERENTQLRILENIANQLKEIQQHTEPREVRQTSLPLPFSKAISKKRRSRSVSSFLLTSS